MDIGTTIPTHCTPPSLVSPETIRDWARRVEAAGIGTLWTLDHLVKSSFHTSSFLDPLVTLGYAACATDRIDLGTSILILPLRRTANVVSQAATIQHLAGGDLILGLGTGYVPEEFEVAGVPREERGPRLSEGIEVIQALFAGEASFHGRFHDFESITIDPVPDSPPRLLAGGSSKTADAGAGEIPDPVLDRIVQTGGWIAPPLAPERASAEIETIDRYVQDRGVDPETIHRVMLTYGHLVESTDHDRVLAEQRRAFDGFFGSTRDFEDAQQNCLTGTIEDVLDRLEAYEAMGFDHVIVSPPSHEPESLDRQLALLADHLVPRFDDRE